MRRVRVVRVVAMRRMRVVAMRRMRVVRVVRVVGMWTHIPTAIAATAPDVSTSLVAHTAAKRAAPQERITVAAAILGYCECKQIAYDEDSEIAVLNHPPCAVRLLLAPGELLAASARPMTGIIWCAAAVKVKLPGSSMR